MEELFNLGQTGPERTDINLWVFPHLKEFLAIDLRWKTPRVTILSTEELFGDQFLNEIEHGFSHILREHIDYPVSHLLDLPMKVEELVRETGILSILDKLGDGGTEGEFPTVAVFIISGAALAMDPHQIEQAVRFLLGEEFDPAIVSECCHLLERLVGEEHEVVKGIDRQDLREALEDQSPNFFTLWERRN